MTLPRLFRLRPATALAALATGAFVHAPVADAQNRSDYLLGRPKATLTLRVGAGRPNASNGVFAVTDAQGRRLLTLNPNQFVGANFGAELGVPFSQKLELQLSVSSATRTANSEYRDFVDNNDLPIEQASRLARVPMSLGLRYNLTPAGRAVSKLAWVPNRFVPYVAAGGGAMYYRFRQNGDFVDFRSANSRVFTARLESNGWTSMAYAASGLSWSVLPAVALSTELRYDHSSAPMRGDFTGFGNTSLSGVSLSSGLQFRF